MRGQWKAMIWGLVAVLLAAAILPAAAEVTLEELLAMTKDERRAVTEELTPEQRKQLHEAYRALPAAEKEAAAEILLPHRGAAPKQPAKVAAIGTVQYDTGVPHGFRVGNTNTLGNRFNTGFSDPHTLTSVTFQLGGNFAANGDLTVFGAPVGSSAPVLTSFTLSGFPINTLVSTPLPGGPITSLSGTFLAGVNQSGASTSPSTTFVNINIDVNSGGAGFHGMTIAAGGGNGFNPSPLVVTTSGGTPTLPFNAILRMTGNNLPVELINFTVD